MTGEMRTRGLAQLVVAAALVLSGAAVLTEVPATAAPLNPCVDPDHGRPIVQELAVEPSSVDVTERPQRVTVRARRSVDTTSTPIRRSMPASRCCSAVRATSASPDATSPAIQ